MTRMMQEATRVLNAVDEGIVSGMICYIKYHNPNISNKKIKGEILEILSDWSKENLDYWFNWLGLNEEKLGEDNG